MRAINQLLLFGEMVVAHYANHMNKNIHCVGRIKNYLVLSHGTYNYHCDSESYFYYRLLYIP
jgi:hypothetical protein